MSLENFATLITLILAGITLISTIVGLSIKLFKALKEIIKNKNWLKIIPIADKAIEAAEKSGLKGEDKKKQAIEATKAGCLELGIDITKFLEDLSSYIDGCVSFFNSMKDASIQGKIKAKASK